MVNVLNSVGAEAASLSRGRIAKGNITAKPLEFVSDRK